MTATGTLTAASSSAGTWTRAGVLGGGVTGTPGAAMLRLNSVQDGDCVTLGSITYVFRTTLTSGGSVANEVLIGSDDSWSAEHLIAAVNGDSGAGTTYGNGTATNTQIFAGAEGSTLGWDARLSLGEYDGGISGFGASTGLSWAGSKVPGTASTPASEQLNLTSNMVAGNTVTIGSTTYTLQAGAPGSAGQVQLGGTMAATLQNLAAAVNGTDGANGVNSSATALASGNGITFTSKANGSTGNGVTATGTLTSGGGATGSWSNGGVMGGGAAASGAAPSDLLSASNAQTALGNINQAISQVASLRGTVGAAINRLQAATNVMSNQVQNLSAAEDGIRSADIADAAAKMSKYNILTQTGMAALSQANSTQQAVLSLLR